MDCEICFISPYPELTKLIKEIMSKLPENIMLEEGTISSAEPIVKKAEREGIEVIVTTQGNKKYLEKIFDIPLVAFPISSFDVVFALNQAKKIFGSPLALFEFQNPNPLFYQIKEVIGVTLEQYIYMDEQDGLAKLREAKGRGIKAIVCGGVIARLARAQGCPCIPLSINEEAILTAYQHAKDVARAKQKERWETRKLKAIVDHSSEGIIGINREKKVVVFNPAAEKMLDIKAADATGKFIQEIIPNGILQTFLLDKDEVEKDKLFTLNQKELLVNLIPIYHRGKKMGSIYTLQMISRIKSLEEKIRRASHQSGLVAKFTFADIIGQSKGIREVIERAGKFALVDETVLISGESGTGKELFAQSMHNASNRATQPFVAVNCAALPSTLLESELFGYADGAFTGAKRGGKTGLFELAHQGTLFLDEIGEIPPEIQSKLLRALERKEIMRIGDNKLIPVNVRIIAATNRNLLESVNTGNFRRDLYHRINILELTIPPLRERKEDILPLALKFIEDSEHETVSHLLKKAIRNNIDYLLECDLPGNVRELENIIKRLLVIIEPHHDLNTVREQFQKTILECSGTVKQNVSGNTFDFQLNGNLRKTLEQLETQLIIKEYFRLRGNKTELAKKLGVGRTTLWRKLNEAGID